MGCFCKKSYLFNVNHFNSLRPSDAYCVGNLTIIGSDNGFSHRRCQAIIWTNAGILLVGPLGTNLSEISIEIHIFSYKKMSLKMSSAKWPLFRLGQAIIWTNAGILLVGPLGTNLSEISIKIHIFSYKKMSLKMSSAKWPYFVSASMC